MKTNLFQPQTDPLTGLFDRTVLKNFLSEFVAAHPTGERSCGMILLDVDNFKSINDAFGHARGDQVLIELGRRLQAHIRPTDFAIRYGGDEFILLLPDADQAQVEKIANRLLDKIHNEAFDGSPALRLTVSMGGAVYPADELTPEGLFERADQRHYVAKRGGRGRFISRDPEPPQNENFLFNENQRLVERDIEFEGAQRFLEKLPQKKRGVFLITGPAGVGKTRFLTEIGKLAQLLGYAVLYIRGHASLRTRMYGAVVDGFHTLPNISAPDLPLSSLARVLSQSMVDKGQSGLLLTVDNLAEVDHASLEWVQSLLDSSEIPVLGLACVTEPDSYLRTIHFDVPLMEAVSLSPLSTDGLRVWLRALLQWEVPVEFLTWFYQLTQGLPVLVWQGLQGLLDKGYLHSTPSGWTFKPEYKSFILREPLRVQAKLPVILTSFIGRVNEIQQLKNLIGIRQLVNIVGPGGIGKTRLAIQAALELSAQFLGEVYFVPLATVSSSDRIIPTIAQTLGVTFASQEDMLKQLREVLGKREVLLILDNFEHLFDGVGILTHILELSPRVKVVVTSRERLNLSEEHLFELEGLPHPSDTAPMHPHAEEYPSVQLFLHRARRTMPDFILDETQKPHVAHICQLVKGMPLGIELAAVWARTVPCQEIATQIEKNLDFLTNDAIYSKQQAGYRSVRAVFDYFWSLLSQTEQEVACTLSLFRGGFTRDAANKIAGASKFFLSALVDRVYLSTNGEGRYHLHDLLRQYTREKLSVDPEREQESLARFATYFADFLIQKTAGLNGLQQKGVLQEIESEQHNYDIALEWAISHDREMALRMTALLAQSLWQRRGFLRDGRIWLGRALAYPDGCDPSPARAHALFQHAILANEESDYGNACVYLQESLEIWKTVGNLQEIARTLNKLSSCTYNKGDHEQAIALRQQALPLLRTLGDQSGLANALTFLGVLAMNRAEYVESQKFFNEAYEKAQTVPDYFQMAYSANCLSTMNIYAGNHGIARQWAEKSLEHYETLDNHIGMASVWKDLGLISRMAQNYPRAVECYANSLTLCQKMNHTKGIAWVCEGMAAVAASWGQMTRAASLLGAAERWLNNPDERLTLSPFDKDLYEQLVARVQKALGPELFAASFTKGEELTLEETIDLAGKSSSTCKQ